MNFTPEVQIDSSQAEAIARGLFAVARADGMHEREAALIAAFYSEAGGSLKSLSELERRDDIGAEELAVLLKGEDTRRLFIKTAVLLTLADGKVTEQESAVVQRYAEGLGLRGELPGIQAEVKDFMLSQLSHLQNVDAVAQVAKKLEI